VATLLTTLAFLWGANYVFIRLALNGVAPALIADIRAAFGAAILLVLRPRSVKSLLEMIRAQALAGVGLGILVVAGPMLLINVGEKYVASGPAAVIASCSPGLVGLAGPAFGEGTHLRVHQWVGTFVASLGVAILVGANPREAASLPGLLALFGSTTCTAAGTILARKRFGQRASLDVATMTLIVAAVVLSPAALASLPHRLPSPLVFGAIAELVVLGTAVAFVIFFRTVRGYGAGAALRPVYLSPAVALVGGALVLNQPLTASAGAGFLVVILGVGLISRPRLPLVGPPAPA